MSAATDRLRAQAKAQQDLSAARAAWLAVKPHTDSMTDAELDDAHKVYVTYAAARAVAQKAYRAFTNPFNAPKTVDARWPSVGLDPALTLG